MSKKYLMYGGIVVAAILIYLWIKSKDNTQKNIVQGDNRTGILNTIASIFSPTKPAV